MRHLHTLTFLILALVSTSCQSIRDTSTRADDEKLSPELLRRVRSTLGHYYFEHATYPKKLSDLSFPAGTDLHALSRITYEGDSSSYSLDYDGTTESVMNSSVE